MSKWWNWILAVALICFLFVAIPLMLDDETSEEELKPQFEEYVKKFNKSYKNPDEYQTRFQHFVAAVREINQLNELESRGPMSSRAKFGLNHLSDMSKAEFKELHLSDERITKPPNMYGKSWSKYKEGPHPGAPDGKDYYDVDGVDHSDHQRDRNCSGSHDNIYVIIRKRRATLPMKIDWRDKGVVGPVRNQGMCGACWAFSTVATMESMAAISTGKLDTLSVQQVIDCAGLGNSGCAGGDICLLLDWLYITKTTVQLEKQYPLQLTDGVCKTNKNATGVRVSTFTCDDFVGAENKIIEALATHGPVTVAVNALTWQNYLGGVIQFHCSGAPVDLNHAVQLVGYDLTADVPYYIAKNSWGSEFGNAGYLMLAVGTNICGLANEVASVEVV